MGVFSAVSRRPVVVGHRGVRREGLAENTPESFAAALREGAEWVELDARRSADGVAVVHHNAATADGVPVVDRTAAQLAGAGLYTLRDILEALPPAAGVNVEVKNLPGEPDYDPDDPIARSVAEAVNGTAARPLLLSSFNPLTVAALVACLPDRPVALVHYEKVPVAQAIPIAVEFGAVALSSRLGAAGLDDAGIAAVHRAGLEVMAWTVNDPQTAVQLAAAGIDALCTDDPATLVAALAATRRG